MNQKIEEELKKYNKFSEIAKWKIMLLKYGVKFFPLDKFNKYENIGEYKTKSRIINLVAENNEVYDKSDDISIIPSEVLISQNGISSIVKLRFSENSPIELETIDNNLLLKLDGKKIEIKISLVKKNSILKEIIPNGKGKNICIGDYVDIVGIDRVSILFFEGCYNWIDKRPCKFCDLHPQKQMHIPQKPSLNNFKNYDMNVSKWWENEKKEYLHNLRIALEYFLKNNNLNHLHIFFMAGNLKTNTDVWNVVEETIGFLSETIDFSKYETYVNVAPHDSVERLYKMKRYGIKYLQYNLEIVNEENFNYTCPGKMKFDEFLNKLYEAVNEYGKGRVRSNFVLGLDDMSETLKFAEIIAKKGIVFDYSIFQPKKGTEYYNKKSPDFESLNGFNT